MFSGVYDIVMQRQGKKDTGCIGLDVVLLLRLLDKRLICILFTRERRYIKRCIQYIHRVINSLSSSYNTSKSITVQ